MRLDHLLSKEHLQCRRAVYAVWLVLSGVMPVAQAIVLRRVLMGGISTNRCLVARTVLLVRTFPFGAGPGTRVVCGCRVVFGTLLGPEATGLRGCPLWGRVCGFVCFWFPGLADHARLPLGGVVCGVWGLGLLFENYIVDASIFEKKQFPRIMNLDLAALLMPFFVGVLGCGWFPWFSREVFFDLLWSSF